ncbi:allophanate hydrolase [Streptomyces acidiscabies]|uniref:Allophanate hydrolase n=1 Tax=Streptomyces acidiscabies TaxID=42234 RepID=A0AAP6EF05_9ACTN|nr:allophanate hydrolase [Streptomyces acidiscabies]MBP5940678.1 allophanate hydrolase [Streptomyces sp. LBUM 1476]MBZ3911943.1 allophanate hydrolase [Streptomyces acidiscabies]MDX2959750.1 allophanate hydrolase [Streptomyces acidiscabies]MDX3022262.1 allophanate hydrolase [Streptomyces acidiscabies]MDX3792572.1 allophanate hydrolase [Streptomyces acidiscabies]
MLITRVRAAYARIHAVDRPEIWITLRPQAEVEAEAQALETRLASGEHLPLAGQLLAVKGNIDVAGIPTTAACPSYAYDPPADAPVVARLRAAGALVLGATNLDQFATGLVGTRSPHGAVRNAHDPSRISGGSSSGSAVAVALGIADLSLGTDTAGSGRVPAAFNGIVGLKPTKGLVPTDGVVPACASLDCVTVFARTLREAEQALSHMMTTPSPTPPRAPGPWRIAIATPDDLGPLDEGWQEAYDAAVHQLRSAGAEIRTLDLTPFTEAAAMLYEGAFVAERYTAVGEFIEKATPDLDPTVATIITKARNIPAHQLFADQAKLATLRAQALKELADADALLLPTTPTHPTLAEVAANPFTTNARLGRFTNSTNLFDLAAAAIPAGKVNNLPFGVMLIAPTHTDERLPRIAELLTRNVQLAVVGAHLTGQPLNPQLLSLGATLNRTTTTAPTYHLYALNTTPPKPGLVHVGEGGAQIETEIWNIPPEGLGHFLSALPRPMTLGKVELTDGTQVTGFLCEPSALKNAEDITTHGGWRAYLETGAPPINRREASVF